MITVRCERCGEKTGITTMSRFNTQMICLDCEDKEKAHPRYQAAAKAELEAVRHGNFNYKGIGLPPDLRR